MGKEGFLHMGCKGIRNKSPKGKQLAYNVIEGSDCLRQ